MQGGAGSPVAVVWLPGRRAGLEFVEKVLTKLTSRTRRSGTQSMLRVPIVGSPSIRLLALGCVVLVVAAGSRWDDACTRISASQGVIMRRLVIGVAAGLLLCPLAIASSGPACASTKIREFTLSRLVVRPSLMWSVGLITVAQGGGKVRVRAKQVEPRSR